MLFDDDDEKDGCEMTILKEKKSFRPYLVELKEIHKYSILTKKMSRAQ